MSRRTLLLTALLAASAAVALLAAAAGAADPRCVAAGGCDCEAAAATGIRQPANAWSAAALLVAGGLIAASSGPGRVRPFGVAVGAAGAAAFAYHATLAGWAAILDGAAVTMVAGTLAAREWRGVVPHPVGLAAAALAAGTAQHIGAAAAATATLLLGVAAAAGHLRRGRFGDPLAAGLAALLLAGGGAAWALAGTAGPWCNPGSPLQGHAAWHVAAAGAALAWSRYLRTSESREPL